MKKIGEFWKLGRNYCFACTVYEGCSTSMDKSDGIFVEGDIVGVKLDLSAGECFFIHNGKMVKERDVCK